VCTTALTDWLPALGYTYKNLVPQVTSDNTVSETGRRSHVTGRMSSCVERVWSEQFNGVQTTPSQRLHGCHQRGGVLDDRLSMSVRPYVFGAGVIISTTTSTSTTTWNCDADCQRVTVEVLDAADDDLSRLAVVLLNNSLFITTYFSVADRRQVHHYIKSSSSSAQLRDVIAHSTTSSSRDVIAYRGGVTLSVDQLSRDDVHVSVINDVALLHVRHVTRSHVDLTAERRRIDASRDVTADASRDVTLNDVTADCVNCQATVTASERDGV